MLQADARGLHGEQRRAFRAQCKASFSEQNPATTTTIPSPSSVAQTDTKIEAKGEENAGFKRASRERRIALVVGNSNYQNVARLNNPATHGFLRSLGFAIVGNGAQIDLDKAAFDNAVRTFGRQLQGAEGCADPFSMGELTCCF